MSLQRLASDYRRASDRLEARREAFFAAICQAHRDGRSLRAIGDEVGLSHSRIQQIVEQWDHILLGS